MTQMSINRRMDKQVVLISYIEMLPRNKKKKKTAEVYATTWMSQRSIMLTARNQTVHTV